MREIVFRGKDLETGEWVYGSLFQSVEQYPAIAKPKPTADGKLFYCLTVVDADTVGQYTGLKDRNGKEIYEGDIALMDYSAFNTGKDGQTYAVVRWIDYRAAFVWDAGLNYYADMRNADNVEICGNIHDNPELLEDGE